MSLIALAITPLIASMSGDSCVSISREMQSAPPDGGRYQATVSAVDCEWLATATEPWVQITSGESGSGGSVTLQYLIVANPMATPRFAEIRIGDQTLRVGQMPNSQGVRHEGRVIAWGRNDHGQCNVPLGLPLATIIAGGRDFSATLDRQGVIRCWGRNQHGQCNVPADLGPVRQIATGAEHVIALLEDGTVRCWGRNDSGQCNVPSNLGPVLQIAAGFYFSIALTTNGTVRVWGNNAYGQAIVPAGLSGVRAVGASGWTSLAIVDDGTVQAWGRIPTGHESLSDIVQLGGGYWMAYALDASGQVHCWGDGGFCSQTTETRMSFIAAGGLGVHHGGISLDGSLTMWAGSGSSESQLPPWLPSMLVDSALSVATGGSGSGHSLATISAGPFEAPEGGHTYEWRPEMLTWELAQAEAVARGGHLATIGDSEELAFVWSLAAGQPNAGCWIGGLRDGATSPPTDNWLWIDGTPWDFTNWQSGEPNNQGGNETRLQMYGDGLWNDRASEAPLPFIIEWSADCNGDGIVDYGQILDGTFEDANANGVPDCCEDGIGCDPCPGDVNFDGIVNGADISVTLGFWGLSGEPNNADINNDGIVNGADLALVLGNWGPCP